MKRVLLEAPILTQSGYGEHSRLVFQSIKDIENLDIMISPLSWGATSWSKPEGEILHAMQNLQSYISQCKSEQSNPEFDVQIHVGIPNEFEKKAPYSVCVTAGIETDRVDASWLAKTHQGIDKIIVPSNHSKDTYAHTGYEIFNKENQTKSILNCNSPIDVIPYPVKHITGESLEIDFDTDFNFLTIALMGPRKNLEATIRGFVTQYKDNPNVGLVIKTSKAKGTVIDRNDTLNTLKAMIPEVERKCKIYLLHGNLTESEIHSLYTHPKIKAYVSTTHGEGYGLPIF